MNFNKTYNLSELEQVAQDFLSSAGENRIFAFRGRMGSGKTTFIAALCKHLGVSDYVSSPTFAIVNEYTVADSNMIFHFDFYRIEDPEELLDIGLMEYFKRGGWCFIEWPELGDQFLPDETVYVNIEEGDNSKRLIKV